MTESNNIVISKDLWGKEYEIQKKDLKFRPAVYAIIIKDDKILLSKQWDGYDFPGGGIELGECIKEALIRETKEETGLIAKVGGLVACESNFFRTSEGDDFQSIRIYYLCQIIGGELSIEFLEGYEKEYAGMPEWIKLSEIDKIKFMSTADNVSILKKGIKIHES